jgi:hypothetical protein
MKKLLRTHSKKILFQGKYFSLKVHKHITPKNTQEYHDKKEFQNYNDNVRILN